MLETYSKNITVLTNTPIPLNNVALDKGCSIKKQGIATIQFNQCGIYKCTVNASATASTTGALTIQLQKNDVFQPQAMSSATAGDTSSLLPLAFTTLIQVPQNNTGCCCSTPTTINIVNTGVGAVFNTIDVTVEKMH